MIATALLSAGLTLIFSLIPMGFAFDAPQAHVVIETSAGLIALLVSFIVLGRFLQTGRLVDLVLAAALAVLGTTNLFFSAIPSAAGADYGAWSTWVPLTGRLLGALGIGASAFVGDIRIRRPSAAVAPVAASCLAALTTIAVVFAFLAPSLPRGIDPALSPTSDDHPLAVGNPALLTIEVVLMLVFAVAAIGFYRRAVREQDPLMGWFAVASVLGAFCNLNYFLFPSLYSEWLYSGDYLRIAFWLVLLGGAANQIQRYQTGLANTAALEERRRLARELHDGLAQELAFIATQTRWLSRRIGDAKGVDQLVVAAERALDESRSAISALTRPLDEPLDAAVAQAAEEVAGRVGVRLKLSLEEGIEAPAATREALVRIVREAVSNTARHGQAKMVTIELAGGDGIRLRVGDDGIGFDPHTRDGPGFGLTSMEERTRALGGELRVISAVGSGTEIEVVLP